MRAAVKQFVAGLVVLGLLFVPFEVARAQQLQQNTVRQATSAVPSAAVTKEGLSVFRNLYYKQSQGRAVASDWASAATAARMMFANWDETGFTDSLQSFILANGESELSAGQLHSAFVRLSAAGMPQSEQEFTQQYQNSIAGREKFVSQIRTSGLRGLHAQIVQALSERALAMSRAGDPRLQLAQTAGTCAVLFGMLAEYLAFVALAAAETGPVALAIAAIGALSGLISLYCS